MKERREYLKRINIVLDFIQTHLDADLSLEQISKLANYSPYHFHRVFSMVVGENLNEFVNRKRIEHIAATLLVLPNFPLKDLAFKYGFNSDSSFSRAFKKKYGISPTKFKSEGKEVLSKNGIDPFSNEKYICSIDYIKQWFEMNAKIIVKELPQTHLAGIARIGAIEEAGSIFQKLMEWGHKEKVLNTSEFKAITLYHDNPNVTQPSKLRFSACVTVNKPIKADGEIRQVIIRKGIYAVGHFEVRAEEISKAWKSMCIWVMENNYVFRDGDYFEIYHNDHRSHPEHKFILDICIPLKRTDNIKIEESGHSHTSIYKERKNPTGKNLNYHQLINFMKEVRLYFHKEYDTYFKLGSIYKGNPDYSYFSLTSSELKKKKLKFVLILNHKLLSFSICLSGQNKRVRKKYWEIFKNSNWNKYNLAESIENSLSIIDKMIVTDPDFDNRMELSKRIEKEALEFVNEIEAILE